ncbi:MAG: hypothetical protein V4596_02445 [Bdellovibrionota bacterium]
MNLKHEFPLDKKNLTTFDVFLVYFKNYFFQSRTVAIMTLVLSTFAIAAPEDKPNKREQRKLIDYEKKFTKIPPAQSPAKISEDDEDIIEEEKQKYFFSYPSSLSLRTGAAANFKELNKDNGDKKVPVLFGFKYMLKSENSKHQEYGLDLLSGNESILYINGGYKYIIDHTDGLRPYYKIGAAIRFDPGDHLETPFDFKSYSVVGSVGLEDLMSDPHSFRLDLDIHWGKEDFLAMLGLGWSWAF